MGSLIFLLIFFAIPLAIIIIAIVQLAKGKRSKGGTITVLVLSAVQVIAVIPVGLVMVFASTSSFGSDFKLSLNEGYNRSTAQHYLADAQSKHSKFDADNAVYYAGQALRYAKQNNNPNYISQDQKLLRQAQVVEKTLSN